jgi:Fe-S-cluster containining protein
VTEPPSQPRVRALSIHADYGCRHSGACCRAGWDIPVEPEAERRIRGGIREGRLRPARDWARATDGLPHGARVVLRVMPAGDCVFVEPGAPRLCAVQRQLGEDAMPSSCRQFPRVATLTPLGVSLTLSHYCPTAAGLLFRDDVPLAVVEDPAAFPRSWPYEGLDARDALPPLLRPGVLMDWPSLERWESHAVSLLAEDGRTPERALDLLAEAAEAARRWTRECGPFGASLAAALEATRSRTQPHTLHGDSESNVNGTSEAWRLVADCVPDNERCAPLPEGLDAADARFVAPAWRALARPIRHWLAAKVFASWTALQGDGLRTTVLGLRVALGVLRAEAARGCAEAGRALDAAQLKEAVRRADLLLVHLADPEALARRLGRCESKS